MIEIKRIPIDPSVHLASPFLLDPPDGRKVSDILPGGINVQELQIVKFNDREVYFTVIGPTPGVEGNWAVNIGR